MKTMLRRASQPLAPALALGSGLGLVHALILGKAGLYATATPLTTVISLARYMAWMGLVAGGFALVGALLRAVLAASGVRWLRGSFPGATLFLAAYLLGWALLEGRAAAGGRRAALAAAIVLAVAALTLTAGAVRRLVRPAPLPRGDALQTALVFLVAATLVVDGAILWGTRGGPPQSASDGTGAAIGATVARWTELEGTAARTADPTGAGGGSGAASPPTEPAPSRNLLLLTFDTLRADHLGCYGYERNTTPALDSLAAAGVRFETVLCQRPKTSPSVATILTGTYPARHGIHQPLQVLLPENLTLAEMLAAQGWTTGAVITNGNLYPRFQFDQGFSTYVYGHKDAATGSERAVEWLEQRVGEDAPWFLWVHHTDPHWPYEPDPPFDEMFGRGSAETRRGQRLRDLYDGEIRYTDTHAGRILHWLADHPAERDRTLVVFTADHGESLGEHDYFWEHGLHPYEPSAHIPLLMVSPGDLPAGRTVEALGAAVDIVPTVMDLLGLPIPEPVQGSSLAALARGTIDVGPHDFVFLEAGYGEHIGPGRTLALRRSDRKYVARLKNWALTVRNPLDLLWTMDACLEGGLAPDEFYDLTRDPQETTNLLTARPLEASEDRALLDAFVTHLAAQPSVSPGVDPEDLDEATRRSLESLGYID